MSDVLKEILQHSYACFVTCVVFIIYIISDKSLGTKNRKIFLSTAFSILLMLIIDSLKAPYEANKSTSIMRNFYSGLGYAFRPTYIIGMIFIMMGNIKKKLPKWLIFSLSSVYFINILICLISIFTPIVFGYVLTGEDAGDFYRGPLGYLPFFACGFYAVLILVYAIYTLKHRHPTESAVIFLVLTVSVIGCILEVTTFYDANILSTSVAIGMVFYYLYLQVSIHSIDQLTSSYNRRLFFMEIENLKEKSVYLASIDLNGLKDINDNFGHNAGDEALASLSLALRRNMTKSSSLYRVGGDEFYIISKDESYDDVEKIMRKATIDLEGKYEFAYGIIEYKPGDNFDEACMRVDQLMYIMKSSMKNK